ncbi:imidazole glycerol phosphate synthase subunit HisH [Rhodoferax saidenbachensis]|uniref:Imidazole glycerol phosphate synthase subunit HisH n=1 Tax=Rhodoferax saidenbachensis TaxID=1484693 RepID=A0ABU1ZKI0_9BURK|nr:imidazole glycerol phosphate synthase subunit HisH [Rhodoferax saidenbachensis]MDR7306049.1 glutamine amidotransferase [Rhodoferax saidenbachensis]
MVLVGIVDCGISNIRSVGNALSALCTEHMHVSGPADLQKCSHLILPGDGTFSAGMQSLTQRGLAEGLRAEAAKGKPILGICLGMQLLAKEGAEFGLHTGLNLIPGRVTKLQPSDPGLPVPQVGWNRVYFSPSSRIAEGMGEFSTYYFMHSYAYEDPEASYVSATFDYAGKSVAIIEHENIFGFQFHPEKSQKAGLAILSRFVGIKG